jgi:hypothetical protein
MGSNSNDNWWEQELNDYHEENAGKRPFSTATDDASKQQGPAALALASVIRQHQFPKAKPPGGKAMRQFNSAASDDLSASPSDQASKQPVIGFRLVSRRYTRNSEFAFLLISTRDS